MFENRRPPKTAAGESKIFICYRRSDSAGEAGRLEDTLKRYFGGDRVFRDRGISSGANWEKKIQETLEAAGVVIVVIGPTWLQSLEEEKKDEDQVVSELELTFQRLKVDKGQDLLIVPVLVDGATMPSKSDLPPNLAELSKCNAVSISDAAWKDDTNRLAKVLALDFAGSVMERKLDRIKHWVVWLLVAPMLITLAMFALGSFGVISDERYLQWTLGLNPAFILLVAIVLAYNRRLIDPLRLFYVRRVILLGPLAWAGMFIAYTALGDILDEAFAAPTGPGRYYFSAIVTSGTVAVMLAGLALSGFKHNDRVE